MSSKQRFNRALRLAKEQGKANRNKTKSVLNNIFDTGIKAQLNKIKQNER
jgi:hypothetical protein|tara:strand:- start:533 stop:682 length:150 start_codon:yes stop_codon:yes gene_type:complete